MIGVRIRPSIAPPFPTCESGRNATIEDEKPGSPGRKRLHLPSKGIRQDPDVWPIIWRVSQVDCIAQVVVGTSGTV